VAIIDRGKRRIEYEMECPKFGYHYSVDLHTRYEGQVEICEVCGHSDRFEAFIVRGSNAREVKESSI
jgi:hypothetical protein